MYCENSIAPIQNAEIDDRLLKRDRYRQNVHEVSRALTPLPRQTATFWWPNKLPKRLTCPLVNRTWSTLHSVAFGQGQGEGLKVIGLHREGYASIGCYKAAAYKAECCHTPSPRQSHPEGPAKTRRCPAQTL